MKRPSLSRGDVILRQGDFALVWDTWPDLMRIFPIEEAEAANDYDAIFISWPKLQEVTRISSAVLRVTAGRVVSCYGWLKVPDLTLDLRDLAGVWLSIDRYAREQGVQTSVPISGMDRAGVAPVWAN